jgi:hypothetical protein
MLESEVDRRTDLPEIQDQGPFETCLSYATSTVHRINKNLDHPLSAEALHYTASGGEFNNGCKVSEVQNALFGTGQPELQHCEPVTKENCSEWSPPTDVYYYKSASQTKNPSLDIVRELIQNQRLPILGVSTTRDFYYPEPPWVFSSGDAVNLHAVVGVGLGEYKQETVVLIRNSWGSDWADSGYAWLDTSFLDEHLERVLLINGSDDQ